MYFLWNSGTCCSFLIQNLSLSSFSFYSPLLRFCHLRTPVSPCANLLTPPSHFSLSPCVAIWVISAALSLLSKLFLSLTFSISMAAFFLILELFFYKLNFPCFPVYWNKCYFLIWIFLLLYHFRNLFYIAPWVGNFVLSGTLLIVVLSFHPCF